jgi:hypothetical protein
LFIAIGKIAVSTGVAAASRWVLRREVRAASSCVGVEEDTPDGGAEGEVLQVGQAGDLQGAARVPG